MKLINKTHWRTDHLKAFVARVAAEELDPEKRKRVRITIAYSRGTWSSGHATIGGFYATIRLSKRNPDKVDFAYVIGHELGHLRGLNHGARMNSVRYRRIAGYREFYGWAAMLPLEVKPKKPKLSTDARRDAKLTAARLAVARWERRVKLATTKLKKWRRRVVTIERRLTLARAAATSPGTSTRRITLEVSDPC